MWFGRQGIFSTIGVEREKILKYVEHQERQDSGQAKLELSRALLVGIYFIFLH
jgi:hypothetical protein